MSEVRHQSSTTPSDLLSTKLALPRLRHSLVPRSSLFALLDRSVEHAVTVLSAPAGFGKTTVTRAWIDGSSTHQKQFRVAWLSLDASDNDPIRFWRYVIAACQHFDDTLGQSTLERLAVSHPFSFERTLSFSFEAVLTTFINDLNEFMEPCVLVMEDYHTITLPQIHETVTFFLDHLPAMLHVMLLSRSDPPLPLARLGAHNDILEVRTNDLRFSLAETRTFLKQTVPFPLSEETITHLYERTEGWEAGLNLVALALRGRTNLQERESFITSLTGRYRPFLEYLVSDVLNAQPESRQLFLLQTSVLSRLTASLCDAVTGRNDSQLHLEHIERANLFLEPLDDEGQWYRYHALFAEAMQHEARRRLGEKALHACFSRAGAWYKQHSRLPEAIEATLMAADFTQAATLVEELSGSLYTMSTNEFYTLRRWLGQLPSEVLQHRPSLCLVYVVMLLFESDGRVVTDAATREQVEALLAMAEQQWLSSADDTVQIGTIYTLRALFAVWQDDYRKAGVLARQALTYVSKKPFGVQGAHLAEKEFGMQSICLGIIGAEEHFFGSLDEALQTLRQALTLSRSIENHFAVRAILLELGSAYTSQGALHQAEEIYRQVLTGADEDIYDRGKALLGLAQLSYEWNNLHDALQQAQEALDLGLQLADEGLRVRATLVLGSILYASENPTQALQSINTLIATLTSVESPTLYTSFTAFILYRESVFWQARLQLASKNLFAVQQWVEQRGEDNRIQPLSILLREELLIARWYLARNEAEDALRLLERCLTQARHHAYTGIVIEAQVVLALAYFKQSNSNAARQTLQEVFPHVHLEGQRRLFLDEGQEMRACLRAVAFNADEAYVDLLLAAFESAQPIHVERATPALSSSLIEPLSLQEQRVLRLFVSGLSKPEIAQELVISVNTVKTHLQHIYHKLHVTSRAEAREVAQHHSLV